MTSPISRRQFIATTTAAVTSLARAGTAPDLVASIERRTIWKGRDGGTSWFHPRGCVVPKPKPTVLMTLQPITGSDNFGQVHWTQSNDLGCTWAKPAPIAALARRDIGGGFEEGVCDVVPQFHPPTGTVLAMGHNVYYLNNKLTKPAEDRWPVYVVRSADGGWSERMKLVWNDARATAIYTSNCGQRLVLENGDVLLALSFGPKGRKDRGVTTARCSFDGHTLAIKETGSELRNTAGRGLLEPSLTRWGGRFFLTIRAEDGHGYVTVSDDGLRWAETKPWTFDDGEVLTMSTTQQHWLEHSERLHLVYTRKTAENAKVIRYRAPIFMAVVDTKSLRLVRATERVVLPMIGDPANAPEHVAAMGNFHPINVTPNESWVTVGEERSRDDWRGDTLLARIRWSRPNRNL
ncbi:MAG: sialidase family protein [Verrucomicrobia bacterium]|nr:sialidase family protein [Verrucomicrobiota bacterium]